MWLQRREETMCVYRDLVAHCWLNVWSSGNLIIMMYQAVTPNPL
jgi:hypothetical protein